MTTADRLREVEAAPDRRRLIAIEPWSASGPGWANAGLTLLWGDVGTGKVGEIDVEARHALGIDVGDPYYPASGSES